MNNPKKLLTSLANRLEVVQGAPVLKGVNDVITTFEPFALQTKAPATADQPGKGTPVQAISSKPPADKAK